MIKVLVLCFVAALWLELPSGGDAVCCYTHSYNKFLGKGKRCNDCTSPWKYCGVGRCNVFGCNCDGGCLTGRCSGEQYIRFLGRRSADVENKMATGRDVIRAGDTDGDGRLSLEEAHGLLGSRDIDVTRGVAALDIDKDHFLDAHEIDKDHFLDALDIDKDHFLDAREIDKDHFLDAREIDKDHFLDALDIDKDHFLDAREIDKDHFLDAREIDS